MTNICGCSVILALGVNAFQISLEMIWILVVLDGIFAEVALKIHLFVLIFRGRDNYE